MHKYAQNTEDINKQTADCGTITNTAADLFHAVVLSCGFKYKNITGNESHCLYDNRIYH